MWPVFKEKVVGYCGTTSIHGFAYLPKTEVTLHWYERVFWGLALGGFLSWSLYIIYVAFDDWARNPTASSTDFDAADVTTIQFPTVTVCAEDDFDRWAPLRLVYNSVQYECEMGNTSSKSNSWARWREPRDDPDTGHTKVVEWGLRVWDTDCSSSEQFKAEVHPKLHETWPDAYYRHSKHLQDRGLPEVKSKQEENEVVPFMFLAFLPFYGLDSVAGEGNFEYLRYQYFEEPGYRNLIYSRLAGKPAALLDLNEVLDKFRDNDLYCPTLDDSLPDKIETWFCKYFKFCISDFLYYNLDGEIENAFDEYQYEYDYCDDIDSVLDVRKIHDELKTTYFMLDWFGHFEGMESNYANGKQVVSNFGSLLQHFSDTLRPDLSDKMGRNVFFDKDFGNYHASLINEKQIELLPFSFLEDQTHMWNYTEGLFNRYMELGEDTHMSIIEAIEHLSKYDDVMKGHQLHTYTAGKLLVNLIQGLSKDDFPSVDCFNIEPDITSMRDAAYDKTSFPECGQLYVHNFDRFKTWRGYYEHDLQEFYYQIGKTSCSEYLNYLTLEEVDEMKIAEICGEMGRHPLSVLNRNFAKVIKLARYSFILSNSIPGHRRFKSHWSKEELKMIIGDYNLKSRAVQEDRETDGLGFQVPMAPWEQDLSKLELVLQCRILDGQHQVQHCRDLFSHVPTNKGMCSAFNAVALPAMLYPDTIPAYNTFNEFFNFGTRVQSQLLTNVGYGPVYGLTLVLDKHYTERDMEVPMESYFTLGLSAGDNYMDVAGAGVKVYAGEDTLFTLTAEQFKGTEDFRGFELEERKCRFRDELKPGKDSSYRFYSRDTCLFECGQSLAAAGCGCVPWDMPMAIQSTEEPNLCHAGGTKCFRDMLMNVSALKEQCSCEQDCEGLKFTAQVNSKSFNPGPFCKEFTDEALRGISAFEDSLYYRMNRYFGPMPLSLQTRFNEKLVRGTVFNSDKLIRREICAEKVRKDLARVRVEIARATVAVIVTRDSRVHYVEQMGVLGGTIGLFTGLSLLSLVELAYWIYLTVRALILSRGSQSDASKVQPAEQQVEQPSAAHGAAEDVTERKSHVIDLEHL